MKKILLLIALCGSLSLPAVAGGNFFSYVVKPGDPALRIAVQNKRAIRLLTLAAEGPQDCAQIQGQFSCTTPVIKAQIAGQPAAVTIVQGTSLPVGQDFYVAGPAYLTVTTNATQTLFLTVFQESN